MIFSDSSEEESIPLRYIPPSQRRIAPQFLDKEERLIKTFQTPSEDLQQIPETEEENDIFGEPPAPDTADCNTDPIAEHKLWVERERWRIIEELREEARVALTIAESKQRSQKTDKELSKQKKPKERTQMRYMQKYFHKGAFVRDLGPGSEDLAKRDFTEATGMDLVDKSNLPPSLQVRGNDAFKKGRSKWTNLATEDTTTPESRKYLSGN